MPFFIYDTKWHIFWIALRYNDQFEYIKLGEVEVDR